jgi:hypothetical protein
MTDPWLETGCWRDVPDDQEDVRTCEVNPDPKSALGLCEVHEHQIFRPRAHRAADPDVRSDAMTILQQRRLHIWGI